MFNYNLAATRVGQREVQRMDPIPSASDSEGVTLAHKSRSDLD